MADSPKIIINFKTYSESSGEKAKQLAIHAEEVHDLSGVDIAIAPQAVDLKAICDVVNIPVYAQHIDPISPGNSTGLYLPEALMEAGINGTLINHSEKPLKLAAIDEIIEITKKYDLTSILCSNNIRTSAACAALNPDFIAIEPPALIASGYAVSQCEPEIVSNTIAAVHEINDSIPVLCGAGITNGDDVKAALDLGAEGVLLASGVVKAEDSKAVLEDLVSKI